MTSKFKKKKKTRTKLKGRQKMNLMMGQRWTLTSYNMIILGFLLKHEAILRKKNSHNLGRISSFGNFPSKYINDICS